MISKCSDHESENRINRGIFQIFNVSLISSFGPLFEPFFEGNNDAAAIVFKLFNILTNLTVLATGFLMRDALNARNFVIIGSMMTFLGLLSTAFASTITQLVFTFPILIGVGLGLLNPAAFVAVLSCFTIRRTYAISFGFAALGLGQLVMPMIVKQSLQLGHENAILVVTGLSLIAIIGAHFLVPIKWKPCELNNLESQPLIFRNARSSMFTDIIHGTDLDLLASRKYISIMSGLCVTYASSMNLNIILPVYLQVGASFNL